MEQQIERNYNRIKRDVLDIIEEEKERIRKDPDLCHLLGEKAKGEDEE
jgi:hypothetical protein